MTHRENLAFQALLNLPEMNGGSVHASKIIEDAGNTFNAVELANAADHLSSLGRDHLRIARPNLSAYEDFYYELLAAGREYKESMGL